MNTKPEILCHPNIPKPLHGVAPRAIMGQQWWDDTRKQVYARYDYHCIACGVHKKDALVYQWLEAHEFYHVNYQTGLVKISSIEPLCWMCHNFIHSGRLEALYDNGELSMPEAVQILEHGFAILAKNNLKCFFGTRDFAKKINARTFGVKAYEIKGTVPWNKWRLLWNGKEYFSKFKNEDEWLAHYTQKKGAESMNRPRPAAPAAPPPPTTRAINTALKKATKVYSLPTSVTEPLDDLGVYSFLIYGQKKVGKSTLASLFPDALFFMFEPGAKALRIKRVDIGEWEDALGYLSALEAAPVKPKTVVIDTGFEAGQKVMRYVCKKEGIEYPREDNFGKDWDKIKRELRSFHDRLFAIGTGVVVLCHEHVKEQQTFTGQKYDQVVPLLAKSADEYYRAVIDNVWWYHYRGKQRFLQIRGTDHAMAGTALQADRFFKTKKGEPVYSIPIPGDPQKGMLAIQAAFKNQQELSFKDETEQLSEKATKESINEKIRKESRKRR